ASLAPQGAAQPETRSSSPTESGENSNRENPPKTEQKEPKMQVNVGPVTADEGNLGLGKLNVSSAKERYLSCVSEHGGMKSQTGEVHVRFLVRESGRAEGVSVAKRVAVTPEAATCVAQVVDRRYVQIPDSPAVGATVVIKFSKQP